MLNDPSCYFCSKSLKPTQSKSAVDEYESQEYETVETSHGQISVCLDCYMHGNFPNLSPSEVAILHYDFGKAFAEGVDYRISAVRLKAGLIAYSFPQLQSAYGYALWKLRRDHDAVLNCREAILAQPNHFGASKAMAVLLASDPKSDEFLLELKKLDVRVKTLQEEFLCCDRIER